MEAADVFATRTSDPQHTHAYHMALIVRDELMRECLSAGRLVEQIMREKLGTDAATGLADSELEEAFQPVMKYVEERTEVRIRSELDEAEAIAKQKKLEEKLDDKRATIKNTIHDKVVLNINGKRNSLVSTKKAKRIRRAIVEEKLLPEIAAAEVVEHSPDASLSELDRDTDLDHYTWSSHWDRFCPTIDVTISEPGDVAIGGDVRSFAEYIHSKKDTHFTVQDILEVLRKDKYTFEVGNDRKTIKSLLHQLERFVVPDDLNGIAVMKFVTDIQTTSYYTKECVMDIVQYFYKKATRQRWCGAYDCYTEFPIILEKKPSVCKEEGCRAKICDECWDLGRKKCEEHRPPGG